MREESTVCILGALVKTSGFTRGVCKDIGDFIEFKGFLVEFLENRRS